MKKHIRVAAAIIYRDGKFLLSKRKDDQHQGGKWEFPGGKIESDETPEMALERELREELGIEVENQQHFTSLDFEYPEKHVSLIFQLVRNYAGDESGMEGQDINWFDKTQLSELTFPDANVPVLNKIQSEL